MSEMHKNHNTSTGKQTFTNLYRRGETSPYSRPIPTLTKSQNQHQLNSRDRQRQQVSLTLPHRQPPPLFAAPKNELTKLPVIVSTVQNLQQADIHVEPSNETPKTTPDILLNVSADTGLGSPTSDIREESENANGVSSAADEGNGAGEVAVVQPAVVEDEEADLDVLIITISDEELATDAWMFQ